MSINFFKYFFGFSFFRFRERYVSFNKTLKISKKNKKVVIVFLHPNIKIDSIKKEFDDYWNLFFSKYQLDNVCWLVRDSFENWWKNFKSKEATKLKKVTFVFLTDKHYGIREYRTILLANSKTFLIKDIHSYVDDKHKYKQNIFSNIYSI